MKSATLLFVLTAISVFCQIPATDAAPPLALFQPGHSHQGDSFDVGPREKPWKMDGIGRSHFPITTSNPEVQMWFDQGNTLLQSFWYFEAERSFRWCLKLEPDNAMAWWGMARAATSHVRSVKFIREAVKREDKVTDRERLYIDALAAGILDDPIHPLTAAEKSAKTKEILETIILKYPDDIEAKLLYVLADLESNRYGNELILQNVLKIYPDDPGAHHYRIHLWNSVHPEMALASCARYAELVPDIGHAQHMPGHIYSALGMYNEAAIAMDTANRVEKRYMRQRMIFPWNDWNYTHNANYLGYVLEQLGMARAAVENAQQVLSVSFDPKYNQEDKSGIHFQGVIAMMRALVKYERWKRILDPHTFAWMDNPRDNIYKSYCNTLAYIGTGDLNKAEDSYAAHQKAKDDLKRPELKYLQETYEVQDAELKGRLAIAKGDTLFGLSTLEDAAKRDIKMREGFNDPPFYPGGVIYNVLGQAYLANRSPSLAAIAFENTLKSVRADPFALAGLVQAYSALGEKEKARQMMGRLLYVWSDADPGLPWMDRARALVPDATPHDDSPRPQRSYKQTALDRFGPNVWEPYPAPSLDATDAKGQRVSLDQFKGRNVLLVFYLGDECPHCLEQLIEIGKHKIDFTKASTDVLAISSNTPAHNAESLSVADLPFRLLSDVDHENARRFHSYDDFEDLELHSTILIDKQGRVHWARTGGDPFNDVPFLLKELARMNAQ
ncbi:MAG: redoxin domain-containing protein [Bryobacteraceae bacterium]